MNKMLEEYLYFMYENRKSMIEDHDDVTQTDILIKQIESKLYGRYCYDNQCKGLRALLIQKNLTIAGAYMMVRFHLIVSLRNYLFKLLFYVTRTVGTIGIAW